MGLGANGGYSAVEQDKQNGERSIVCTDQGTDNKVVDVWGEIEELREIYQTRQRLMAELAIYEENIIGDVCHAMIDNKISSIIGSYSFGYTVQCNNITCNKVINFNNNCEIIENKDYQRNKIAYYVAGKSKSDILKNDIKYHKINGKYMRIFCKYCKNILKTCQHSNCNVNDVYVSNNGSFFSCGNHKRCYSCCFEPMRDSLLDKCNKCLEFCCEKCYFYNSCRVCTEYKNINDQRKIINEAIVDILDMNSISVIASF
eukprot:527880_1